MKTARNIALSGVLLCLVHLFVSPVSAGNPERLGLDLSGAWKVRLGDNPEWSEPVVNNDVPWDTLSLPGNLAGYSMEKNGSIIGRAWVRKTFHAPEQWDGKRLGLVLGRIAHTDETYLNGVFIGGEGDIQSWDQSMWYKTRFYAVPEGLIKPGADNVIAIRIQFHTMGEFSGRLALIDHATWLKDKKKDWFLRVVMSYVIISMCIPLIIIFFVFYIQQPKLKEYFYFSIQLICGLSIGLDLCFLWDLPEGITLRFKLVMYSWLVMVAVHAIFLHQLYGIKREKVELGLSLLILVMLPVVFLAGERYVRYSAVLVLVVCFLIGIYIMTCHYSPLVNRQPYSRLLCLFGVTVLVSALHDGIIQMSRLFYFQPGFLGYDFDYMLFPFGGAFLFIGTSIVLAYRFVELVNSIEDLKVNLEKKVTGRTRSLIRMTEELERQNVRLKDMALRDSLTGLYNHASFCDRLDEIFMTARESKTPMAVAMIDVDDFKGVNDTFGHQAGDQVLIEIAAIMKNSIREYDYLEKSQDPLTGDNRHYDLAGRYGGDEFMMALPQCNKDTAIKIAERILAKINAIRIGSHPELTVCSSFGLAVLPPGTRCPDSEALTSLADEALYMSKSLGKNRVFCKVYER